VLKTLLLCRQSKIVSCKLRPIVRDLNIRYPISGKHDPEGLADSAHSCLVENPIFIVTKVSPHFCPRSCCKLVLHQWFLCWYAPICHTNVTLCFSSVDMHGQYIVSGALLLPLKNKIILNGQLISDVKIWV